MDYGPLFDSGIIERMPARPTPPPSFAAWLAAQQPEPEPEPAPLPADLLAWIAQASPRDLISQGKQALAYFPELDGEQRDQALAIARACRQQLVALGVEPHSVR